MGLMTMDLQEFRLQYVLQHGDLPSDDLIYRMCCQGVLDTKEAVMEKFPDCCTIAFTEEFKCDYDGVILPVGFRCNCTYNDGYLYLTCDMKEYTPKGEERKDGNKTYTICKRNSKNPNILLIAHDVIGGLFVCGGIGSIAHTYNKQTYNPNIYEVVMHKF